MSFQGVFAYAISNTLPTRAKTEYFVTNSTCSGMWEMRPPLILAFVVAYALLATIWIYYVGLE
jgi:hypothetical protein